MIKIRDFLFELICTLVFLINLSMLYEIFIIVLTIIYLDSINILIISTIIFVAIVAVLIIIVLISIAVTRNSKKNILILDNMLIYNGIKYDCNKLSFIYHSCKWYYIPIAIIYKSQQGGLIEVFSGSERILMTKIFYKEYLILRKFIVKNSVV